ncbi:wnt-activated inhibitory factor 2 [Carcharodon carcharias]|uniref:wnt-activated inhibitory factor 2 n=1 Tax=Carcharodon carcharias TaxID=13397 RepID=UPI001B7F310C|nr:wnt-activated inhibitory factor 2 [Carcharodon carcharias]
MSGTKQWSNCPDKDPVPLTSKTWPLSLAVLGVLVSWAGVCPCPLECRCADKSRSVECRNTNLTQIPQGIPLCAQNLLITGNNISTLRESAFVSNGSGFARLGTLSLPGNQIQGIGPSAFEGLANLRTLNLSGNALASIAADAFFGLCQLHSLSMNYALEPSLEDQLWTALHPSNLPNLSELQLVGNYLTRLSEGASMSSSLEVLDLRSNLLHHIGRGTISSWQNHIKLKVYLFSNPLMCDCELQPVYWWLKNTSQIGDRRQLTCFGPKTLNGSVLHQLRADDLKCPEDTAASYVFLGIVLALIGATFIMVLYLNRRGIKRWARTFQVACHDLMEGYEYRYELDPEPRLASVTAAA